MAVIEKIEKNELPKLKKLYDEFIKEKNNPVKMEELYDNISRNPDYFLLGLKEDGELLGTMMCIICYELLGECRPFMIVENIVIADKAKRSGFGTMLMNEAEKIAIDNNCSVIQLLSSSYRKEAHYFYEKIGYRGDIALGFRKYL